MIPDYTDINRGLKRKINKAWRDGLETLTLNTQFLRNVSVALDSLVAASKRGAIKCGTTWRITSPQTNADLIRAMTDEELSRFLGRIIHDWMQGGAEIMGIGYIDNWLDWLRQEVEYETCGDDKYTP